MSLPDDQRLEPAIAELIEPLTIFSDNRGRPCNGRAGRRVADKVHLGQDPMTNPVARVRQIVVRLVIDPCLSPRFEVAAEIGAADVEQRPNDIAAAGINSAEAGEPGSPNELQQEGLCLIVSGVTDGDPIGRRGLGHPVKKVVPEPAGGILD